MCCDYGCGSFTEGVGCMDIQLSDEPNLGTWTVNANHLIVSMPRYMHHGKIVSVKNDRLNQLVRQAVFLCMCA